MAAGLSETKFTFFLLQLMLQFRQVYICTRILDTNYSRIITFNHVASSSRFSLEHGCRSVYNCAGKICPTASTPCREKTVRGWIDKRINTGPISIVLVFYAKCEVQNFAKCHSGSIVRKVSFYLTGQILHSLHKDKLLSESTISSTVAILRDRVTNEEYPSWRSTSCIFYWTKYIIFSRVTYPLKTGKIINVHANANMSSFYISVTNTKLQTHSPNDRFNWNIGSINCG